MNSLPPDFLPKNAKDLLDALEGICPAIEAIAEGGAPYLEERESTYAEPPIGDADDEHLIHLRVPVDGSIRRDEFLDFGELRLVIDLLTALRVRWTQ